MLALTAFHMAILLAAGFLLVLAAISDARRYRIPNRICFALLVLFPFFILTSPEEIDWAQHLMVFMLVLISGFMMFVGNLAGAGDIKLLAVTGLWAGPHLIAVLLITTAISGGLLALTIAFITHIRNVSGKQAVILARVPIPYGIAIAIGGLNILYMMSQPILFPG